MKTELKLVFGLVGVMGLVGCGSAGPGDFAEEETVGEASSALTYNERLSAGTRRDYNGDGIEDMIVSGPNGAQLWLGKVGGSFVAGAWSRSDLPYGVAEYVAGDFNGDHRSDLIITTDSGSYQYFGTTTGNLATSIPGAVGWIRNDLRKGTVKFTVGDFNHDGRGDLIASNNADGLVQYLGKTAGGFTSAWSTYVTMDRVALTAGDFNGDGATDVIFTVADSSELDLGIADPTGGFVHNVWTSFDYPLHGVEFYVGNYNGTNIVDGRTCDDVIAKTVVEARELLGVANGGFNPPTWQHPEWNLMGNVQFVPGDYNGDGKTDVVVSTGGGTSLYLGKSGGGFNSSTWSRSDVDAYHVAFTRGEYSKDGRDDLIITLGNDPKNVPGSKEYLGQPSGATPAGFTGAKWTDSNIVISGPWAIF